MSDPPLSPQEIRAAAAAYAELGPEYSDAVAASLERVEQKIVVRAGGTGAGASMRTGSRVGQ
jgi:ribose 5-phosphate isomerase RpiB